MTGAKVFPPDAIQAVSVLKDFQRRTVDYVFRRLYLDGDKTLRFLIADEVGLGKTLVARGLIAKAIEHLWDKVERIDIIYICSNADIARQNIARLNVTGADDVQLTSRITLLPVVLKGLKGNRLNFVSFTPGTSFDLKRRLGTMKERALLYWLLKDVWDLKGTSALNVLQGGASKDNFRRAVKNLCREHDIDRTLSREFRKALRRRVRKEREAGQKSIRTRFKELCRLFGYARKHVPRQEHSDRVAIVGELRSLLAATCMQALEPDVIILDEFQRFKHLLQGDDPASQLARGLFDYSDDTSSARVILLSATPYKMYTMHHEADEEDHYSDFQRTVEFLLKDEKRAQRLKGLVADFRRALIRLRSKDPKELAEVKRELEHELRRIMVRTERLGVTPDRRGMLIERWGSRPALRPEDATCYRSLQRVARCLGHQDTMEYWKSAPYLLNFMDGYDLKDRLEEFIDTPERNARLCDIVAASQNLLLPWSQVVEYDKVDPRNARLRWLASETLEKGAWRALWISPSLPYYQLAGPYADPQLVGFTKRLVFSSWRVVPKVVSVLLSYEAERQVMTSLEQRARNTPEARRRRRALLNFTRSEGRLTGMPVLGLLYPSVTLACECDPIRLPSVQPGNSLPTYQEVIDWARERILKLLQPILAGATQDAPDDESWYWAAPILLDLEHNQLCVREWFADDDLAASWHGEEEDDEDGSASAWSDHVEAARGLLSGKLRLGRPPSDLGIVLAHLALGGPAITSLRALSRVAGGGDLQRQLGVRIDAGALAWAFLTLFNRPEAMALIRGMNGQEPYWRQVLEYSVAGGLQPVLDEYVHVLQESLGHVGAGSALVSHKVAEAITQALTLRAATLVVDEVRPDMERSALALERHRMRVHFAARLADEQPDEGQKAARKDQVRHAFNSPFWPFVLVTTSVGQEGLDFHPYCHAVVHWNLPSNPVDLEQREGRVHRYKGHAVRKNLSSKFGAQALKNPGADPWQFLFDAGARERAGGESDLVPFWVYPVEGGASIERHVPMMPLSRDAKQLADLKRSLAVYRMVFGQARQEDLVQYLLENFDEGERSQYVSNLQMNLAPPE